MDYNCGQSTWPLLLVKVLLSALQLFFSLAFSPLDIALTQALGKENAGFPGSSLTLNLFCLMDQLAQLPRNETKFTFLVVAVFVVFFIVARTYRRRSTRKQPPRGKMSSLYVFHSHLFCIFLISLSYRPFKRGRRNGSSNMAFGCSRPTREGNECNLRTTAQF